MPLPDDFAAVLANVEQSGILAEDSETINSRLALAVQGVALKSGQRNLGDLGIGDWTLKIINRLLASVHNEICDQDKRALKENYQKLLNLGLTPEGIKAVSAVVTPVVSAINPAFAVSSVVIFLAIWLLKRGLGQCCS